MAPYPEEIDVFTLPHSRMKELVDVYREKLLYTDFKDYQALRSLLQSLHHTFCEFKSHEQIENKYIMRKLKKRLKLLSIHDATVCNCHSDNKLSDMLALVEDGYSCTSKTEAERLDFGIKLQQALHEFTGSFLPHMKEEEEVFQPMLMKYFAYDELKSLKQQVIKEHSKWHTQHKDTVQSSEILQLPHEVVSHIMSFLSPKDLLRCSEVCRKWYEVSKEPVLWKRICPSYWARGIWENYEERDQVCAGEFYQGEENIQEQEVLRGVLVHLLPRVGTGVQDLILSSCRTLSDCMLQAFLKLCPNVSHLDLSYSTITDSAFRGLKHSMCCSKLQRLNLSGCRNMSDLGLYRLAECMSQLPPSMPDASHHLRNMYLEDCHRFQNYYCEIEDSYFTCISNEFCTSSCCWQKDGLMCHLAKLSLHCPYLQQPGVSSIRKTTATPLWDKRCRPQLKFLSLSGLTDVTDDGLKCLQKAGLLGALEFLDVSGCWLLTGAGLVSLVKGLPLLKPENLYYCDQIEDGPYPNTSNGCQNLETGIRACCRL